MGDVTREDVVNAIREQCVLRHAPLETQITELHRTIHGNGQEGMKASLVRQEETLRGLQHSAKDNFDALKKNGNRNFMLLVVLAIGVASHVGPEVYRLLSIGLKP